MKKETKNLLDLLKNNNQDFEFYPTTKEMIHSIYRDIRGNVSVLDIGAGNGNFKKWFNYYGSIDENDYNRNYEVNYYAIEKSDILLNQLDKDTFILGTDFNETTLIDKKVDIIFCNPPYTKYVEWTKRIIKEGNCKSIYLVIPQRWKDNEEITLIIEKYDYEILDSFDFLNAERQARAKVDILKVQKYSRYEKAIDPFYDWFDETFKIENIEKSACFEYKENDKKKETLNNEISIKKNIIEVLTENYNKDLDNLQNNFKVISSLDASILKDIGVHKRDVVESLRKKVEGLKTLYWRIVFDRLNEITSRLTEESRKKMFEKFKTNQTVDFNSKNIYGVLIWIIKNASSYYNEQLISLYKDFSSYNNVVKYKSNQKVFEKDAWRFRQQKNIHYTLDYRIVCDKIKFRREYSWGENKIDFRRLYNVLNDFKVIAGNLGFNVNEYEQWRCEQVLFGKKYYMTYSKDKKQFCEFKLFKNGNIHIKFDLEFMKAFNVEASRLLGWIRSKDDISKEFNEEMSNGAEKYFENNVCLNINNINTLLIAN